MSTQPQYNMPPAPWKHLLESHISTLKPAAFSLATLSHNASPTNAAYPGSSSSSSSSSATTAAAAAPSPRVRTMIYRGFLGTLPANAANPLQGHNPAIYSSDLPTFTTDARTSKAQALADDNTAEACFWIPAAQNQWRLRGRCYLLAAATADASPAVTNRLMSRLHPTPEWPRHEGWTWRREVEAHFANLSPAMRGSFAAPPPGMPLECGDLGRRKGLLVKDEDVLKLGGEEEIARENFRLGVLVPEVVERVDLGEDEGQGRRWVWWWVGEGKGVDGSGWEGVETWP